MEDCLKKLFADIGIVLEEDDSASETDSGATMCTAARSMPM